MGRDLIFNSLNILVGRLFGPVDLSQILHFIIPKRAKEQKKRQNCGLYDIISVLRRNNLRAHKWRIKSIAIAIIRSPGCDIINFETNLIFLIKSFFCRTKKSKQRFKYLEKEKSFKVACVVNTKLFFIDWFYYDSILLVKYCKISNKNLGKVLLFSRNQLQLP